MSYPGQKKIPGGMSLPPVELAKGGQICKKKLRHIFFKNQKINNIKIKKSRWLEVQHNEAGP